MTSTNFGARGLWDTETLEIFRGPQSTVSGRNALAGTVNIRSKDPSFQWGTAARLSGGNLSTREGALMFTGPLVERQLAFRLSGEYHFQDTGFRFPVVEALDLGGSNNLVESKYANVKARLLFTPTALPGLSARLSYGYAFDRPTLRLFADGPDFEQRVSASPFATLERGIVSNASLEVGYDLGSGFGLTSVTTAHKGGYEGDGLTYVVPGQFSPLGGLLDVVNRDLTQELRLNYEGKQAQAVVGVYGVRAELASHQFARANVQALAGRPVPIIYEGTDDNEELVTNAAAFGEVNVEATPSLTLTASLRYDREYFKRESLTQAELSSSDPTIVPDDSLAALPDERMSIDSQFDALLPKLGVTVSLAPDVSLGATVQRGYRSGGADLVLMETNQYDPEYVWNHEASFRSRWLGGRLTANANAFYGRWTDQQLVVPVEGVPGLTRTENAGTSRLYGGEAELRVRPTDGLTLFGSFGLVEAQFKTFEIVAVASDGTRTTANYAGNTFPHAASETFSLGGIYKPMRGSLMGFFAAADLSYTGPYYSDPDNSARLAVGGYTLVNGRFGYNLIYQGTVAGFSVFARNLLDEVAMLEAVPVGAESRVVLLGMPRVVGVTLDVQF